MKYLKEIKEKYKDNILFTKRDIFVRFKNKINTKYLDLLIHNLIKKGEIRKLAKGKYTFSNKIETSGFAYSPFYYGLQDAMSYHGLWEQETNPIIITIQKIKPQLKQIMNNNVLLRRISRKYYFGIEYKEINKLSLPISDLEKTIIDLIYYKQPIDTKIIIEIKKKINKKKLKEYLKRYPTRFEKKALDVLALP